MMSVLFMQTDTDPWAYFTAPGSNAKSVFLVIAIVVVLAVVFFAWAAYIRTPRKSHVHYHSDDHDGSGRRRKRSSLSRLFGRKHHRRRKRTTGRERPANPTLSQIGGLPPRRDEQHPHN